MVGPFGCTGGIFMYRLMQQRGRDAYGFNVQYEMGNAIIYDWSNLTAAYRLNQVFICGGVQFHKARPWEANWARYRYQGLKHQTVRYLREHGALPMALSCGDESSERA